MIVNKRGGCGGKASVIRSLLLGSLIIIFTVIFILLITANPAQNLGQTSFSSNPTPGQGFVSFFQGLFGGNAITGADIAIQPILVNESAEETIPVIEEAIPNIVETPIEIILDNNNTEMIEETMPNVEEIPIVEETTPNAEKNPLLEETTAPAAERTPEALGIEASPIKDNPGGVELQGGLEIQGTACNGNYAGGNWLINSSISCSNESFTVNGTLIIRDDSETAVTSFGSWPSSAYNLRGNSTDISATIPALDKPAPSSQFTRDWDSDASREFYIVMNESQHMLQIFLNTTGEQNYYYTFDIDKSDSSGISLGIDGADLVVGYYVGDGYLGPVLLFYNGTGLHQVVNGNESSSGQVDCDLDPNLLNNYTVYWAQANGSSGSVWGVVIDANASWVDKETSAYGTAATYTTFKNSTLLTEGFGNLTLTNVSLDIQNNLEVQRGARFAIENATIKFQLFSNGSVNMTFNSSSIIRINNSVLTSNATGYYWGWRVYTGDYNITNNKLSYNGLDGTYWVNRFEASTGGLIYNNTFNNSADGGNLLVWGGDNAGMNISYNTFWDSADYNIYFDNNGAGVYVENNDLYGELILSADQAINNYVTNNTVRGGRGIYLTEGTAGNILRNNNISKLTDEDTNGSNTLVYSNSYGEIKWENKANLSVNTSLALGNKIYIASNNLSVTIEDQSLRNLNFSAQLTFYSLNNNATHYLYKNGIRCDNSSACNITSDDGKTTIAQVSLFSSYNTSDPCGSAITSNTTLTNNFTCNKTAIVIGDNELTLNCAGYTINYSAAGGASVYGIENGGYDDVAIENCKLYEGRASTSADAIRANNGAVNVTIENNSITTCGTSSRAINIKDSQTDNPIVVDNIILTTGADTSGIDLNTEVDNANITRNTVNTSGSNSAGIVLWSFSNSAVLKDNVVTTAGSGSAGIHSLTSLSVNLSNNTVITYGDQAYGIYLSTSSNSNTLKNNTITTNGSQGHGIYVFGSSSSTLTGNVINATGETAYGVYLSSTSNNNVLLNNNLSSSQTYEIYDDTGNLNTNYLVYNNSFGEIRWTNTSNGGFLKDMDVNCSGSLALGTNLFIGNNTAALNTSAFSNSKINSSANITLRGLSLSSVDEIKRLETYSTDSSTIIAQGANCNGTSCWTLSYGSGTLLFNTSYFSSFSANEQACGYVNDDLTLVKNVSSTGTCFTINASNIVLDCAGYTINYSTSSEDLGYAVDNNGGFDNVTIKNCNIYEGDATINYKYGVLFSNDAQNGTIVNNSLVVIGGYTAGILIENSSRNNVANNTVTASGSVLSAGITLNHSSTSNTLNNNTITTSGQYGYGIFLYGPSSPNNLNNITSNSITTGEYKGIAIYLYTNASNSTIANNIITTNGTQGWGIVISFDSNANTLTNNTINTNGTSSNGIYITESVSNTVTNNTIVTYGTTAYGIEFEITNGKTPDHDTAIGNVINTSGDSAYGIVFDRASNKTVTANIITTTGTDSNGMDFYGSSNSTLTNNTITTVGSSAYGIYFTYLSGNHIFLNNNISANKTYEIYDQTGDDYINYLIYNNSFGEIRWTDTANDSFLKDMDVNSSGSLALGANLYIGNNTAALNTSAFAATPKINSSANITLRGLSYSSVNRLMKLDNYTTDSSEIIAKGTNCAGGNCSIISYDSSTGTLLFNTTNFSSFAGYYEAPVTPPPEGGGGTGTPAAPPAEEEEEAPPAAPEEEAEAPPAAPEKEVETETKVQIVKETTEVAVPSTTTPAALPAIDSPSTLAFSLKNTGKKSIQIAPPEIEEALIEALPEEGRFEDIMREKLAEEGLTAEEIELEIKKRMELEKLKEQEELIPIITTKFFSLGIDSGIIYSDEFVSGRLLKSEILNPKGMLIKPGETKEESLEIRGGISARPRSVKVVFKSLGEEIFEKEVLVREKAIIGTAVDVDAKRKVIDVYMVIPAVESGSEETEDYLLELNINKEGKTEFGDLYGPYKVKRKDSLVFAQQLEYDPKDYYGEYLVKAKILRKGEIIAENEFEIDLGEQAPKTPFFQRLKTLAIDLTTLWIALLTILCSLLVVAYVYRKRRRIRKVVISLGEGLHLFRKQAKYAVREQQRKAEKKLGKLAAGIGETAEATQKGVKYWLRKTSAKISRFFAAIKKGIVYPFKALILGLGIIISTAGKYFWQGLVKLAKGITKGIKLIATMPGKSIKITVVWTAKKLWLGSKALIKGWAVLLKALKKGLLTVLIKLVEFLDAVYSWPIETVLKIKAAFKERKEKGKERELILRKEERKEKTQERKENALQLKEFVASSLAQGIPQEEIKTLLTQKGWPREIVEEYAGEAEKKTIKKLQREEKIKIEKEKKSEEEKVREKKKEKGWAGKLAYVEEELRRLETEGIRIKEEKIERKKEKIEEKKRLRAKKKKQAIPKESKEEKEWKQELKKDLERVEAELRRLE